MTLDESMLAAALIFGGLAFAAWYLRCLWWIFCSNMSAWWFLDNTYSGPAFVMFHVIAAVIGTGYFINWVTN